MTTENQAQPPVNPNPASSLPRQEKWWRWDVINEGLSNVWCGNDFLACCATLEAKALCESHNATLSEPKPEMVVKPWLVFEDRDPKVMLAKLHIGDCAFTFDIKYAGYLKVIAADRNASVALVEPDAPADNAQAVLQKTLTRIIQDGALDLIGLLDVRLSTLGVQDTEERLRIICERYKDAPAVVRAERILSLPRDNSDAKGAPSENRVVSEPKESEEEKQSLGEPGAI